MRQIFVTVIQLDIVVIESREKTDISEYTLKPNFLRCHQKTYSPHVPCTKHKKFDSTSGQCSCGTRLSFYHWLNYIYTSLYFWKIVTEKMVRIFQ